MADTSNFLRRKKIKDADVLQERLNTYEKDHCWQYDIRLNNLEQDLLDANLTLEESKNLKVSDFTFKNMTSERDKKYLTNFIKRHEWLGDIGMYTTHWFACYYKDILAGVVLMGVPVSFSKLLGKNTEDIERIINRGACISWSPKNLASSFIMWCIKWMVNNTEFRIFTAYSDPTAKELGTIYQACNFYYLGKNSGGAKKYISPYSGRVISDRSFRNRSYYKRYAKELNITWERNWNDDSKILWENIPDDVEQKLRDFSKKKQKESKCIEIPPKHKYTYVLGKDKKETKQLRRILKDRNKIYDYPKNRGE